MKTCRVNISLLFCLLSICSTQVQAATFATRSDVVAQLNKARNLPSVFAAVIQESYSNYASMSEIQSTIYFLNTVVPLPALSNQSGLDAVAQFHANYLNSGVADWLNPDFGCNNSYISNRVALAGTWNYQLGEDIAYGIDDAEQLVASWVIDNLVASKKNRMNIFNPAFTDVGVGISGSEDNSTIYVVVFAEDFTCTAPCVNASRIGGTYNCEGNPFAFGILPKVTAALFVVLGIILIV